MARVTLELPSLLQALFDGRRSLPLEADTLAGAFAAIAEVHPKLAQLLFDERGRFRQHVSCFHNEVNTRWLQDLDRPLADGDRITVMQAVSGG